LSQAKHILKWQPNESPATLDKSFIKTARGEQPTRMKEGKVTKFFTIFTIFKNGE
jgi:hypothetical protein